MSKLIQSIRGFRDILPTEGPAWAHVESTLRQVLGSYGYAQIRLPLLESTELFKRSIGEVTDIVEKEMYTFDDREEGNSLTLRPEGTAGCLRAALQHGLMNEGAQRLWYAGPMFRHERPQRGRYRQFHQVGVEVYGLTGPDIDAEMIIIGARLWRLLGINDVELQINSLGSSETRAAYRDILIDYLKQHEDVLDEDSRRRLTSNPLRVLDSKNPDMQAMIEAAPKLIDHLDGESKTHFDQLCAMLDDLGIAYRINTRLVRGLDYYSRTVFEWVTGSLGAQGTICAGGRYDGLVEQLGGKPAPAIGFAVGVERLIELVKESGATIPSLAPHAYLVTMGDAAVSSGRALAERLRDALPGLRLMLHCGGGNFKNQLKKADRSGAELALILGEQEVTDGVVGVKYLRRDEQQATIDEPKLLDLLKTLV